jgi:Tfp pilus assembly protein PilP
MSPREYERIENEPGRFVRGRWVVTPTWRRVPPTLDDHERRLTRLEGAVGASCRVHAGIHPHGTSEVIVCGELAGRDYVRIFRVADGSVPEVVRMLESLGRTVPIGRVDAPLPRGSML